jgi:hypothetical protein
MQSNERPYGKEKQADRTIKANHELLQLAVARTILCLAQSRWSPWRSALAFMNISAATAAS